MNMKVLAIIQARGGSKGVPGKNIKLLAGKPLIAWTIEAAKNAKTVNRVIVSTDDQGIADVAKSFGAEVPFLRPAEFATDNAKSLGLLRHALDWFRGKENYIPDIVVQLKPTNPLRTAEHIDACIASFLESPDIDSLITVTKSPAHPLKTWKFNNELLTPFVPEEVYGIKEAAKQPRQSLPEAFVQNSCVHVISPSTILEKNSSIGRKVKGFVMEREDSMNIDTAFDFEVAELLMKKRSRNGN
jgi:N-acylneuraminate cytidylyltransferase